MTHRVRPLLAWLGLALLVGACASPTSTTSSSAPSTEPAPSASAAPAASPTGTPTGLTRIPGTRVSMVPAPGFVAASNFAGFAHPSGAGVEVVEVDEPLAKIAPELTVEGLAPQGIVVETRHERKLDDGHDAVLLSGKQTVDGVDFQKIILVTGDETSSALITANIPLTAPDDIEPLALAMMLSTRLSPDG